MTGPQPHRVLDRAVPEVQPSVNTQHRGAYGALGSPRRTASDIYIGVLTEVDAFPL
ncbi:hypothetical protein [Streptomyces muensis]|uniref:Uncharacterized protein n=1 Tax=Streptomyces muensis TaxID=1077944 RepID=A0A9X1TL09_STRM4|nr:hypothetical protein [Streptomyces muensis]MCF1594595.1 hypothetical protein [Streptomyces muensis]